MFDNNDASDESTDADQSTDDEAAYGFIAEQTEEETTEDTSTDEQEPREVRRWSLGDHSVDSGLDSQELDDAIENVREVNEDLAGVLEETRDMVETTSVSGFECPVCGLNHGHSDSKHDLRSAFNVEADFADQMEYCPYCHCGVNELAMLVDFFHYISIPVFTDQHEFEGVLEVPPEVVDEVHREMKESRQDMDRETLDVKGAVRATSNEYEVPREVLDELETFYERKENIKSAADSAPIAGETREAIEDARKELESVIQQ